MTLEEVAHELGLKSSEKVRQIESLAIKKLRGSDFKNELDKAFDILFELEKNKAQNDSEKAEMKKRIIKGLF